jgi:hypothetical protein
MEFKLDLKNISPTDEELIVDIKRVALLLNKNTVTINEYNKHGKFHATTLQRRFHSWFIVLQMAELEKSRSEFNIDDKLLLENIADVWIKLGRQPTANDMKGIISKYGTTTYLRHFGSWNNALLQFIQTIKNENVDERKDNKIDTSEKLKPDNHKNEASRTISLRLRFSVFLRDGFRCQACGKSPVTDPGTELHCDHIIPWSKGGKTTLDNLRTLCSKCNLGKGNIEG